MFEMEMFMYSSVWAPSFVMLKIDFIYIQAW